MVCLVALVVYDYFLTLEDEVAEFHDGNDIKNLTASPRFVMHGRRIMFPVRKFSCSSWSTLNNDISVFVMFLFVSTPTHSQHHTSLTFVQIRYFPLTYQVWLVISKWDRAIPRYPTRINIIGHRPQRYLIRDTHPRYGRFVSDRFFRDADDHVQMYVWKSSGERV